MTSQVTFLLGFCLALSCAAEETAEHREGIKSSWEREMAPFRRSYEFAPKETEILYRLVTNSSPEFYQSEYQRLTSQYVPYHGAMNYDYALLQGIVLNCIRKKNLKELQTILKVNCPSYIINRPLEYLVVSEFGTEAFEIFFDAFETAVHEGTKNGHFEIIRRSFHSSNSMPAAERVRLAKSYYRKWKKRLRANPEYIDNFDPKPELWER